jgi:hypothetical protein
MTRSHQPDQAVFKSILPEDIDWQPFPAFPPAVRLAVLVGHPSEPGPYVIRVKASDGTKLMPHRHPEDRIYTRDRVARHTAHFHWAKSGAYVTQVTAIGPLGLEYLDPADDPRRQGRQSGTDGDKPHQTSVQDG